MILIACWNRDQNASIEEPTSVRWEDGSPSTLDDYHQHMLDTHKFINEGVGPVELHMFPSIVAEVSYDVSVKAWRVSGRGVIPATLDITDPQAKDDEIIAELYTFPIVYRATIKRTAQPPRKLESGGLADTRPSRPRVGSFHACIEGKPDGFIRVH